MKNVHSEEKLASRWDDAKRLTGSSEQIGNIAMDSVKIPQEQNIKNDGSNTIENNPMEEDSGLKIPLITDREVLSIVSLGNIKLEFANLRQSEEMGGQEKNHTILSFLNQLCKAIKERIPEDNPIFDLENTDENNKPINPLYTTIDAIKIASGIIYEYYEKHEENPHIKEMLEQWELLYAADGHKLVYDYINFLYGNDNFSYGIDTFFLTFLVVLYEGKDDIILNIVEEIQAFSNLNKANISNNELYLSDEDFSERILTIKLDGKKDSLIVISDFASGDIVKIPDSITKKLTDKLNEKINSAKEENKFQLPSRKDIIKRDEKLEENMRTATRWGRIVTFAWGVADGFLTEVPLGVAKDGVDDVAKKVGTTVTNDIPVEITSKSAKKVISNTAKYASKKAKTTIEIKETVVKMADITLKGKYNKVSNSFINKCLDNFNSLDDLLKIAKGQEKKFLKALIKIKKQTTTAGTFNLYASSKIGIKFVLPAGSEFNGITKSISSLIDETTIKSLFLEGTDKAFKMNFIEAITGNIIPTIESNLPTIYKLIENGIIKDIKLNAPEIIKPLEESDNIDDRLTALRHKCHYWAELNDALFQSYYKHCINAYTALENKLILLARSDEEIIDYIKESFDNIKNSVRDFTYSNTLYSTLTDYPNDYFDFRFSVLKNESKKTILICFNGNSRYSKMINHMKDKQFKDVFLLFDLLKNYLIEYLLINHVKKEDIDKYSIKLTGSNLGAELATMFNLATNYDTTVFKTKSSGFVDNIRVFNTATLASLFNMKYYSGKDFWSKEALSFFSSMALDTGIYGNLGYSIGISIRVMVTRVTLIAALKVMGFSTLVSAFFIPIVITTTIYAIKAIENSYNNDYYAYFYVQLCKLGFVSCTYCKRNNKKRNIKNCLFTYSPEKPKKEKEPPLVSIEEMNKILNKLFPMEFLNQDNTEYNITIDENGKTNVSSGPSFIVTGDTFLNIITEFYSFKNNIKKLDALLQKPDRDHFDSGVTEIVGISNWSKGASDSNTEFMKKLETINNYDNDFYNKMKKFFDNYTNTTKDSYYTFDYNSQKVIYLFLEKVNNIYVLRKRFYYRGIVNINSQMQVITSDKDYEDTSLGMKKHIFLKMISFIKGIQAFQDALQEKKIKRKYIVYAFGSPKHSIEKFTHRGPIIFAQNTLLDRNEIKALGGTIIRDVVGKYGEIYKKTDVEIWNEEHNKKYGVIHEQSATEFVFFPFINDKTAMIAHEELFCNYAVTSSEENQTPSQSQGHHQNSTVSTDEINNQTINDSFTENVDDFGDSGTAKIFKKGNEDFVQYHDNIFKLNHKYLERGRAYGFIIESLMDKNGGDFTAVVEEAEKFRSARMSPDLVSDMSIQGSYDLGRDQILDGVIDNSSIPTELMEEAKKIYGSDLFKNQETKKVKMSDSELKIAELDGINNENPKQSILIKGINGNITIESEKVSEENKNLDELIIQMTVEALKQM